MKITITLDKHEAFPGEKIDCVFCIDAGKKVKIKLIEAAFSGEFLSIRYGNKSTSTNRNVFVRIPKTLWTPADGKADTIGPGVLECTASFEVPPGLMPSFPPPGLEGNRYPGRLQFFISCTVKKTFGFDDDRFERVFIRSRDFISSTTEHRRSGSVPATRFKPEATLMLDKSVYKPGETITCKVGVAKQDASCIVHDIRLALRGQCWGWVDGSWIIEDIFRDEYSLGNVAPPATSFALVVPDEAAPTLYGGNVKVTWDVHLHVKLSMARDLHLTVPILVATKGATVPSGEASRDANPGTHFCPACGSPVDIAASKCTTCGSAFDDA